MDILTIDMESFYSKGFSLSSITTEEYLRDPKFEVIGVAVKVNEEETRWFSGTKEQTKKWLDQFNWDNAIAIAHNAAFDMAILSWHFDIKPKRIVDTLSMARAIHGTEVGGSLKVLVEHYALGAKGTEVVNALGKRRLDFDADDLARYGEYCINDVELTYALFKILVHGFPINELRLIDLTIRMFTEPVLELDAGKLTDHLTAVQLKKASLMMDVTVVKEQIMSNPQLADVLRKFGVEPPTKISPITGKETYAFGKNDEGFKALLEHEDVRIQTIIAARLGLRSTLEETRTERFLGIQRRGKLPIPLRYYAAHTGRWGGDDKVNMQNIPRSSPLKKAILAPEGYVLIDSDSSQIEARTLAWLAGQEDLVKAFDRGDDVYKIMASAIYGKPESEITKEERFVGKTTVLGCLAEGTLVLTDRSWVAIEEVTTSDRLWDGEEWVCHQGLVKKGTKETLNLCGLWLTPDHKVLCGTKWLEAQSVAQDRSTLSLALDTGAVSWLSLGISVGQEEGSLPSSSGAIVGNQSTLLIRATSRTSKVPAAHRVVSGKGTENGIGNIAPYSLTSRTESGCSIGYLPRLAGATYPTTLNTSTTGRVGYTSGSNGGATGLNSYGMFKRWMAGMFPNLKWTAQITTEDTSRETSSLYPEAPICETDAVWIRSRRKLQTYDLALAGPRNRFTVLSDAGPIIVHNCGYGMGAIKFRAQLKTFNVDMSERECERIISVYRETYPEIPKLWRQAGRALNAMLDGQTAPLGRAGVLLVTEDNSITLPNGLRLKYPNLRRVGVEMTYDVKRGRAVLQNRLYGGKCVENICQALARIVIGEQMLMIAKKYRVVMTVHDAIACVVPEEDAAIAQANIEMFMRMRPIWAMLLPLDCEAGSGKSYGDC